MKCRPDYDVKSIEQKSFPTWEEEYGSEYLLFLRSGKAGLDRFTETLDSKPTSPRKLHFSLKSGPLGPGASLQAGAELLLFIALGKVDGFKGLCKDMNDIDLLDRFTGAIQGIKSGLIDITNVPTNKDKFGNPYLSRLTFLSNPAGKTRIVYILGGGLQELIKPLHEDMMSGLKKQPQDATYNASKAMDKMKEGTAQGLPVYSFDLKGASDRGPRDQQLVNIIHGGGKDTGRVGKTIMEIVPYCEELGRYVEYAIGQPMGAYSSGSTLAVSHHLLIRFAGGRLKIEANDYFILGDDLIIQGHELAGEYQRLINSLAIEISKDKSLYPMDNCDSSCEFAKNIVTNGVDYTPVSPNLVDEVIGQHHWGKGPDLLREMSRHYGLYLFTNNKVTTGSQCLVSSQGGSLIKNETKLVQEKILQILMSPISGAPYPIITQDAGNTNDIVIHDPKDRGYPYRNESFEGGRVSIDIKVVDPGESVNDIDFLMTRGTLMQDALQRTFLAQIKLREDMYAGRTLLVKDEVNLLTALPHHPIWNVTDQLTEVINLTTYFIAHGDYPPGYQESDSNVLLDADQLSKGLVEKRTKQSIEFNKATYRKVKRLRINEVYLTIKNRSNVSLEQDGTDG